MQKHRRDAADVPTETSPLLSKDTARAIEPIDGIAPDGPIANGIPETDDRSLRQAEDEESRERPSDQESGQQQYEGMPEVKKRMHIILPALAIGIYLGAADQTIVVSSYGRIGSDLNALNQTSWIATAYFLTLTSFQPLYGKLSDIFGRKSCLLFGYVIFGLGALFCGLAQDMNQLIAARAFAGIGAGGMSTVVSILMSDIVPLRERGKWQGYVNIVFAAGAASGAPLGGLLADSIGWRWAFLGQVPLCLLAFVAVTLTLHLPKRDDDKWMKKLRRVDFIGAVVLICAVFTLLLAMDHGSNVSWKSPITIASISVSIPLFVAFMLVETKVAKEPFAPGRIIFHRTMVACYLCNFFAMAGWLATQFYIPLHFQVVNGMTAGQAGLRLLPNILCGVCGSLFGGFYMQKTGKYYWITVIANSCLTLGVTAVFLLSGVLVDSTIGIILALCVNAFSNGLGITTTLIGLISNASREDQAVATACSYLFRSLGSVFGVSISATVANWALRRELASELPSLGLSGEKALEIAERVRQSLQFLRKLDPDVREVVVECYSRSISTALGLQIVLIAGAAVSAWFINEKALAR